jgi:hypothetical protein
MANRIATCPQSKQISGSKTLAGIVPLTTGPLPWKNVYNNTASQGYGLYSPDGLTGTWANGPASFNVGDFVLVQHPFSSLGAPAYVIYICVTAFTPAPLPQGARPPGYSGPLYWSPADNGSTEAINWQQWDLRSDAQGGASNYVVSLGGLPVGWQENNVNPSRTVWGMFGAIPTTLYLNLEYSTSISGSANGGLGIDGTYTHSWSVNRWTGTGTDNGGNDGNNAPAAARPYLFPAIPPNNTGWTPPNEPAANNAPPLLSISLAADGTSISFVFVIQFDGKGNAAWTVTQTAILSGVYTLAQVQTDALALLKGNQASSAAMFATMNWGQAATCTYNADGSINVAIGGMPNSGSSPTTCATQPTTTAAAGIGSVNQDLVANAYTFSTAQIDVCGQYCLRTFYCQRTPPAIQCQTGSVDGYHPITLAVPAYNATDGYVYSQIFPNCQC